MALDVIQISDTHLSPRAPAFSANFAALAAHVRAAPPDLVIHTGDVTRDAPGAPEELAFAAEAMAALGVETLAIPGNHDVGDNPGDGGYRPAKPWSPSLNGAFVATFGGDRFAAERGGWRLVGINTQLFLSGSREEEDQWDWLAEMLAGHPRIALFLHKPLFREAPDEPADVPYRYVPSAPRERLAAMIAAAGVRAVGCGHVHQTRAHRFAGAEMVWAPSTAFVLPDAMQTRIGDKTCGAIRWRFGQDGSVEATLLRPEGIADHDLSAIPGIYP